MELMISAIRVNGDDNIDIELVDPAGRDLPPFAPGAHIDIRTPAGRLRQYSLCGPLDDARRYLICVRKDAASRGGSQSLHHDLRVRSVVEVSAPRNHFALPEAKRYLLFSAGIGLTPIISMARRLAADGATFEWHHFERSAARVAFFNEFAKGPLAAAATLHLGDQGDQFRDNSPACLERRDPDAAVLACGPDGFLHLLETRLLAAGWAEGQFYSERFRAEPAASVAASDGGFEVRLASSGRSFVVGPDQTIANVLLENGVAVDLSCEQGVCGACLTRVVEGQPDHRDSVLSAAEHQSGEQMTICCSRAKSAVLVLDL